MIQTSPRKKFLKDSLAALSRHELLFILLDEIPSIENGVKVEFLDREAIRAKGPILFLERTSSPILPMFIGQDEKNHFKIFVEEPFEIEKKGTDLENMDKNINGLSNIVEHFVKRYPFQWGGWLNRKMVPGDG
jgi:KDO2-lipid IV(A) lauroyltransferase